MRRYYLAVSIAAIIYVLAVAVFIVFTGKANSAISDSNVIKLSDITRDAQENWENLSELAKRSYGADFVIINNEDKVLYASDPSGALSSEMSIEKAFANKLAYAYVVRNGQVSGCVIIPDTGQGGYSMIRIRLIAGLCLIGIVLFGSAFLYGSFVQKRLIEPMDQMKGFAESISEGNFDRKFEPDKNNAFRAFSDSFDIMKDELERSREREISVQEKECELIATLSRDLRTPVTGMKLMTELIQTRLLTGTDPDNDKEYIRDMLEKLYNRAGQVETHVNTLLSGALEDMGEFKVSCSDVESHILGDMVRKFDEKKLVTMQSIPFVLIHIDTKRMRQVIGNIMDNAYKYAKTGIDVAFLLMDEYMQMKITDHGPGVGADEIGLITNRFYRGRKQAGGEIEGSGLGLYIAKKSMENMGGQLLVENTGSGLCVTLLIKLS